MKQLKNHKINCFFHRTLIDFYRELEKKVFLPENEIDF